MSGSAAPTSGPLPATGRGQAAPPANRLAGSTSPYLNQHASNPVYWWPWGDEAFAEAKRRDVPVFLSIGYSTCHWCHVMAHESFEDPPTATLLNKAFVCIKVDREERPDVDQAYMAVCQAMTGSGGWPLTVLLTPDRMPFFAGTYFPRESRHGRIGVKDLCARVEEAWRTRRAELEHQAAHIVQHVQQATHGGGTEARHVVQDRPALLASGVAAFATRFDAQDGGFGGAPKFPSPHHLLFLLRMHARGEARALPMVVKTLDAMACGGLQDHLGGGFHRYSTDAHWLLPHFEKMLYDQALLLYAYAEAASVTGDPRYAEIARSLVAYVVRDLQEESGLFMCGEDADSEGSEGRFYLWSWAEVEQVLGPRAPAFCEAYGVTRTGNAVDEATGKPTGKNVLAPRMPASASSRHAGLPNEAEASHHPCSPASDRFQVERTALLSHRARRVRPSKDTKVLLDWNALMVAALARTGWLLADKAILEVARRAGHSLLRRFVAGRCYHCRDPDIPAFLDDEAYLLWALVELHQATRDGMWLGHAVACAQRLQSYKGKNGLRHAGPDAEVLVVDATQSSDGAMPSATGVVAWNLQRLHLLTGDVRWRDEADTILAVHGPQVTAYPHAFAALLLAFDQMGDGQELAVTPGPGEAALWDAARGFAPHRIHVRADPETARHAPWVALMSARDAKATAFVCSNHSCQEPTTDVHALKQLLAGRRQA